MTEQLNLFETPDVAPPVWSTLAPEERALVLSVLARLMARAVADLRDQDVVALENGHD